MTWGPLSNTERHSPGPAPLGPLGGLGDPGCTAGAGLTAAPRRAPSPAWAAGLLCGLSDRSLWLPGPGRPHRVQGLRLPGPDGVSPGTQVPVGIAGERAGPPVGAAPLRGGGEPPGRQLGLRAEASCHPHPHRQLLSGCRCGAGPSSRPAAAESYTSSPHRPGPLRPHPGRALAGGLWRGHSGEARTGNRPRRLPGGSAAGGCWLLSCLRPSPSGKTFCDENRDKEELRPLGCTPGTPDKHLAANRCPWSQMHTCPGAPDTPGVSLSAPQLPRDTDPHRTLFPRVLSSRAQVGSAQGRSRAGRAMPPLPTFSVWAVPPEVSSCMGAGDGSARAPGAVGPDQPLALSPLTGDLLCCVPCPGQGQASRLPAVPLAVG